MLGTNDSLVLMVDHKSAVGGGCPRKPCLLRATDNSRSSISTCTFDDKSQTLRYVRANMLPDRLRVFGLCTALVLFFSPSASAESEGNGPSILWYRSSEGCPDSASFLGFFGDRAAQVRLAEAGDRVDFVVNLALGPEGARGRLERETARGTVAIREVEDASCEKVAQVIALNLSLALEPSEPEQSSSEAQTTPAEQAPPTESQEPPEEQTPPPSKEAAAIKAKEPSTTPRREREEEADGARPVEWRMGLQGGVASGLSKGLLGRGTLFLEARSLVSSLPDLTVRSALLVALGSSDTEIGPIRHSLWAGELRVCPVALHQGALTLDPCLAGELGQLGAAGPLRDSAFWAAVGAHGQARWALSQRFALDGDVGAHFPLLNYEIMAGSAPLYRSAPVGFSIQVGASVAF